MPLMQMDLTRKSGEWVKCGKNAFRTTSYASRGHPGQNPGAGGSRSGGLTSAADEVSEARNGGASWDADPVAEVVPEGDAELLAGLGEAEEGVAALAAKIALGAAADLALGHLAADVVLGTVGVQRDLWMVEHHQQLGLVGVQPLQQAVERDEAGAALEDAVEAGAQLAAPAWCRRRPVGLEVGVEPPDQAAHVLLGGPLRVAEGLQLVDQALGVDPAQCVLADVELPGVITDDDRL